MHLGTSRNKANPVVLGCQKGEGIYFHKTFVCPHSRPSREIILQNLGWLGEAKVSCILRHRDVHLILAYSWARPAILAAGKGRGGTFLFGLFLVISCIFSSPEQRSRRAIVVPPSSALALASASTNVKSFRLSF